MSHRKLLQGLLIAALIGAPASVRAADLDAGYADIPQPEAEQKVEFGSGWYVRGDIAATRLPDLGLESLSQTRAPEMIIKQGSQLGYTATLGGGYAFTDHFRMDATFDFHKPVGVRSFGREYAASTSHFVGTCQIGYVAVGSQGLVTPYYENCHNQYEAAITSYDFLVNGYYDLVHWGFATPYVGAGLGMAFGHYSSSLTYYLDDGRHYDFFFPLPSGNGVMKHGYLDSRATSNYYNLAFALMGGVAFDIYDHTKLDIGYRYVNLGKVLNATIDEHEVRAGLRYMIDN